MNGTVLVGRDLSAEKEQATALPRPSTSSRRRPSHAAYTASLHSGHDVDARSPSVAHISLPPSEEELTDVAQVYSAFSIEVIALLMPSSVLGALARLGIHALAHYNGDAIFPLAWVQATGCFFMGVAFSMKGSIGDFYSPLYTAVTTGFCGSVTTFSSWQLDVFQAWDNAMNFQRGWFRTTVDGVSRLVFTMAISLSALAFGIHIGKSIQPYIFPTKPPSQYTRAVLVVLSICIYSLTIPFYVRLDPSFRPKATAALMFSFPGTLTRYLFSYSLNPRLKLFPLGTLTANSLGTALLAMFHVLQATVAGSKPVPCGVLQGLVDGYCGCLTTVSTFALEVRELKGYRAWLYVILSCLVGQMLCLIILGPSWWVAKLNPVPLCPS